MKKWVSSFLLSVPWTLDQHRILLLLPVSFPGCFQLVSLFLPARIVYSSGVHKCRP